MTNLYVSMTLEDELAALNHAALLIDGEPRENVVPMVPPGAKMAERTGVGPGA